MKQSDGIADSGEAVPPGLPACHSCLGGDFQGCCTQAGATTRQRLPQPVWQFCDASCLATHPTKAPETCKLEPGDKFCKASHIKRQVCT